MPDDEHRARIQSLNQNGANYTHYESADDVALDVCELATYEHLHPYGQVHVWIGPISVVFFKLLYSDRRAKIHVFCDSPVTDVYSLVKPDLWCQFDVHRVHPSALSADLLSAVLSQGLVDLANVMTLHHECPKDSDSLVCLLSSLPTSNVCLRTECCDGHFTVVKAWPEIDHDLLHFRFDPEHADEAAIQRLLQHHDNLQIVGYMCRAGDSGAGVEAMRAPPMVARRGSRAAGVVVEPSSRAPIVSSTAASISSEIRPSAIGRKN